MEADWEFEIGPGAYIIDAHWPGFIDLTIHPESAALLPEARKLPALADTLARLNARSSSVWTAKCDLWPVDEQLDSDELNAAPDAIASIQACYIDLLAREPSEWNSPQQLEGICGNLCNKLRATPLRNCRADLVIRRAVLVSNHDALGITAYVIACGRNEAESTQALARALTAFADAVVSASIHTDANSLIQ